MISPPRNPWVPQGVEGTREGDRRNLTQLQGRLWEDFSFVASSGYRERVITSLIYKPKLPKQVAQETNLRMAHVSRALQELRRQGLVECLTPSTKRRGRLYALSPPGSALIAYMNNSNRRFAPSSAKVSGDSAFIRKIRGSSLSRCILYLKGDKGEAAVRDALKDWSVNLDSLTEDTWISMDAFDEFLELLEARFGDGSYEFVRRLYARAAPSVSSIREQILRIIPLEALAERAPIVYSKEWNYGRLEVKTGRRRASFLHFDWMPTPAMCAVVQGVYEGILSARGVAGTVKKTSCVRTGDDHCEYVVEW